MEFLIVDSFNKRKPIAIIGKIRNEVAFYTSNQFIARVLRVMLKPELKIEKAVEDSHNIELEVVTKDSDDYLKHIGFMLEPPLRRHSVGKATVRDIKTGLDKLWKIYIGSTPPKTLYTL